jgi:hypothetical protein
LTVIATILAYAVFRLTYMVGRMNPNISIFEIEHVFNYEDSIDFHDDDFMIAFGVESVYD